MPALQHQLASLLKKAMVQQQIFFFSLSDQVSFLPDYFLCLDQHVAVLLLVPA